MFKLTSHDVFKSLTAKNGARDGGRTHKEITLRQILRYFVSETGLEPVHPKAIDFKSISATSYDIPRQSTL